jgi:Ca-activated chloride channel family protein
MFPQFANPAFLLLAAIVPLWIWRWLHRRRSGLRYSDTTLLKSLPAGRGRIARWGEAVLRTTGLLLLVIALAGPRWPDLRTRVTTEGIAIQMVVDVSGSMAEPDFAWKDQRITRLEAIKRAFALFVAGGDGPDGERLEGRPDDLIGLVTFATRPESPCPLTLSHSVLLRMLEAEQPRSLPTESQTNIGDAIAWALHRLENAGARRKILVLLSDGEHNVPPPAFKPRQAAQLAATLHVPIYAIDAGGDLPGQEAESAGAVKASSDPAQGQRSLQAVTKISGGRYFRATDGKALLGVCQEIDLLERRNIQSFQYRRYYEGYPWFSLVALMLLASVVFLDLTWWRRIP